MQLGMILPQTEIGPDPATLAAFAHATEDAGFEFIDVYDHVIGADTSQRDNWMGPYTHESQFHEVFVLYGYLAAITNIELMTGVLILPQRQTVLVAKQAAQLDVLTGGKFTLGVGIGWNPVEYESLNVDFRTRAALYEEQIEVLRLLWTQDVVTYLGRFHTIDRAGLLPRPIQRPIPIWMGGGRSGGSRRIFERIGRLADGWVCNMLPGPHLDEAIEIIKASAVDAGRDEDAVAIQGILQPRPGDDPADSLPRQLERWRAAGATRIAVSGLNAGRSPDDHIAFIGEAAAILVE